MMIAPSLQFPFSAQQTPFKSPIPFNLQQGLERNQIIRVCPDIFTASIKVLALTDEMVCTRPHFIAIYCESNILHSLETSENIAIPENITIFLRYFFMHDISHFWPFMDQLTIAIL